MKKRERKLIGYTTVLLLVLLFVSSVFYYNAQKTTDGMVTMSVEADGEILYSDKIPFDEGETLLELMEREMDIEETDTFIHTIEGVSQNAESNLYWTYYLNDDVATTGTGSYVLKNGDLIFWELMQF